MLFGLFVVILVAWFCFSLFCVLLDLACLLCLILIALGLTDFGLVGLHVY